MAKAAKSAAKKPRTKSQILSEIAEQCDLSKKQVAAVFDALADLMKKDLQKRGPEVFTIPNGLIKVSATMKKATPAREGTNPKTGEKIMIKAQKARKVIKVRALKNLKEMIPTDKK